MKKLFYGALAVFAFSACTSPNNSQTNSEERIDSLEDQMVSRPLETENPDPAHNSQNSVDWIGTYETVLPCADCPGIKTVLVLHEDETFQISSEYLERDTKFEDKGTFVWQNNGSTVHLKGKDTDIKLKVGENRLFQLDQEGKEITGDLAEHYMYKKQL
ncbi:copper resistance protein NlpE N-terminal domain-containing protein [Sphingobacterium sp. DN00404]|uniref:Copper resistance protein NlpE N-terminal domain-containing protein n=1 Tax=Sphingobacterium micropteri TaxID=2763501 RepID=A0ABR7YPA1_9SPHI|nr:copper resistance protein NlpE [Sphingobacterium micropteri]MBD1433122.1 copper resistance protein NlpE N-terminal domain-containing protein [Sphingobacterium micropteri]